MVDEVKIGKIYKRSYQTDPISKIELGEQDYIAVYEIKNVEGQDIVVFSYIDDPTYVCEWNLCAFRDGMEEI